MRSPCVVTRRSVCRVENRPPPSRHGALSPARIGGQSHTRDRSLFCLEEVSTLSLTHLYPPLPPCPRSRLRRLAPLDRRVRSAAAPPPGPHRLHAPGGPLRASAAPRSRATRWPRWPDARSLPGWCKRTEPGPSMACPSWLGSMKPLPLPFAPSAARWRRERLRRPHPMRQPPQRPPGRFGRRRHSERLITGMSRPRAPAGAPPALFAGLKGFLALFYCLFPRARSLGPVRAMAADAVVTQARAREGVHA